MPPSVRRSGASSDPVLSVIDSFYCHCPLHVFFFKACILTDRHTEEPGRNRLFVVLAS